MITDWPMSAGSTGKPAAASEENLNIVIDRASRADQETRKRFHAGIL
jgi:hypothetical protein